MAILRNHTQGFTIVNSDILKNPELKLKERGLLITLLSLPDNWEFSLEGLCMILPDGKASIRTSLQILEELGYIVRRRLRNEQGQLTGTEWEVYDVPLASEENPEDVSEEKNSTSQAVNERKLPKKRGKKRTGKKVKKTPKCENRTLVKTTENRMVEPKSDFPTLDNPTLENRTQYNTNNTTLELQIDKSNIKRDNAPPEHVNEKENNSLPLSLSPEDYDTLVKEFSKAEVDYQIQKIRDKGYANCMNLVTVRKWCMDKRKTLTKTSVPGMGVPGSGASFAAFPQRQYDYSALEASLLAAGNSKEVPG